MIEKMIYTTGYFTKMTDDICYRKNYLKEVHFRIDFFEPIQEFNSDELPVKVRDAILEEFTIPEHSISFFQEIQINHNEQQAAVQTDSVKSNKEWIFHSKNRDKTISFNSRHIHIFIKKYESYELLQRSISAPLNEIAESFGDRLIARIGVRFVNIYDFIKKPSDIKKFFQPAISAHITLKNTSFRSKTLRRFLIDEFVDDDIRIRLQSGIFNPDFPAEIMKNDFLIDIDAFVEGIQNLSTVHSSINELHKKVQITFESCITDKLRDYLND